MKKIILFVALFLIFTGTVSATCYWYKGFEIVNLSANNKPLTANKVPAIYFDDVMVPLKMLEQIGASYTYNSETKAANLVIPSATKKIVFLGDSMMEYGKWDNYYEDVHTINKGIAGNRVKSVIDRLEKVMASKPDKIFILIGINDLFDEHPFDLSVHYYDLMLTQIMYYSPKTKIYTVSLFPVNTTKRPELKGTSKIADFNAKIKYYSDIYKAKYINVYPLFDVGGQLNPTYTTDGVHPNAEGYKVFADALKPYIYE